jgi:hypothetical protein
LVIIERLLKRAQTKRSAVDPTRLTDASQQRRDIGDDRLTFSEFSNDVGTGLAERAPATLERHLR